MFVRWKKSFNSDPDLYIGLCLILLPPAVVLMGAITLMQFAPSNVQPNLSTQHARSYVLDFSQHNR